MKKNENHSIIILKEMSEANIPVGAIYLGEKLQIPQASVGRILQQLEEENLVAKIGRKGRIVTKEGEEYIREYDRQHSLIQTLYNIANIHNEEVSRNKLLEVMEVRLLLEIKTAELACKNRSNAERDELKRYILEWKMALHNGETGSEQDLKLHLQIAKMANNDTLYSMCRLLLTEDNVYTGFSANAEHLLTIQSEQHETIVNAIVKQDANAAKEAMRIHLISISNDIKKGM